MANRNWASAGKLYSMHVKPVLVTMKFKVDATQTIGISNLMGPTVQAVYMNSSAGTPAKTVAAGTILVQLADNYNQLLSFNVHMTSPSSGSDVKIDNSALTAGVAYTITTLGNATAAKWAAIGVPAGVTPAVGVNFIAATNGGTGNTLTSRVQATATAGSGIDHVELVPTSSGDVAPNPTVNQGFGAQFILQCYSGGTKTAPAAGTIMHIDLLLSDSAVVVNSVQNSI